MRCCVEKGAPLPSLGEENNKKKDKSSETSDEEVIFSLNEYIYKTILH